MSEMKNKKKVEYYVDFESWYFMAASREEAIKQANARLDKGEQPAVVGVDVL